MGPSQEYRPLPPIATAASAAVPATVMGTGSQPSNLTGARRLFSAWELADMMGRPELGRDRFFLAIRDARGGTPPGTLPSEEAVRRVLWSLPFPWVDQTFEQFALYFNEAPLQELLIHVRQVALPIMEVLNNFQRAVTSQARRTGQDVGDVVKNIFECDHLD